MGKMIDLQQMVVWLMNLPKDDGYSKIRRRVLAGKRKWLAGQSDLYRFSKTGTPDFTSFHEICLIRGGMYDYEYFNICFLNNVLALILECIMEHRIPVVQIVNEAGDNIWEQFFEQPCPNWEEMAADRDTTVLDKKEVMVFPGFQEIFSGARVALWRNLYQSFVRFCPPVQEYIDGEVRGLLEEGRRVLGVLCRGTDYIQLRPTGHPVQPDLEEILDMAERKLGELSCDFIYLATEEGRIDRRFRERFPDKILVNRRVYYDEIFQKEQLTWIKDVHFDREDDDYWKGVEYLSSLVILSKCHAIVAGNCGGSQAAVFMNDGTYEDVHIYDMGLYP